MRLFSQKMRGWLYLSILPVLLVSFSAHASKPHAKAVHARIPHRMVRTTTRTGEACVVDHVDGDTQLVATVSLPTHREQPKTPVVTLAAMAAPDLRVFADAYFALLARGDLDFAAEVPAFDPRSPRGPPSFS